ncbi:MAG: IS630 family transposase [Candidatus Brocadiales bacterium]|nr:IS630 family transposase [Candidatus Brocadiales bacterium]
MRVTDIRWRSDDVHNRTRKQAIKLLKSGKTQQSVADSFGVHLNTIGNWWRSYQKEGRKALHAGKRGLRPGQGRVLTAKQEKEIQLMIIEKTPDQFNMPLVLWDRKAVKDLIQRECGVSIAIRTVGDYLRRWNYTSQRPARYTYRHQPEAVQYWLNEEYPKIQFRSRQDNAEVHWGDETQFRKDHYYGTEYFPNGKATAIRFPCKRIKLNMISTVSNQGKVRFMIYKRRLDAKILINFLKRLTGNSDRKVFLIMDNLKVHRAKSVRKWLMGKEDEIEIFFLPSYSPEINPGEYLNNDINRGKYYVHTY